MTEVYIIRHGETEWNRAGLHQGHKDSPLTENGLKQAELLGARLADEKIDAVYSSDLGRAMDTARAIAAPHEGLEVIPEPRLRERGLGVFEGLTHPEIEEQMPEQYVRHANGDPHFRSEGGESFADTFSRACPCLRELAIQHDGGKIVAVAHGGVLQMALRDALGLSLLPPRRFALANAALNLFTWKNGDWMLKTWGDTAHMKGREALDETWQ